MRRSRKFLTFILILLAINSLFFISWYALDLQGKVKGIIEHQAGIALKGNLRIRDFSISDQQVFAEGISFAASDSTLSFDVDNARLRYNLLKFIFSGFKVRNLLNKVEISGADVTYSNPYPPKPGKIKKKIEIPDLTRYFNELAATNSRFRLNLRIPLKVGGEGILSISEQFSAVKVSIKNTHVSKIAVSAVNSNQGALSASGVLDKGRLATSHGEVTNFNPLYLRHPQLADFSTEMNLVCDASQKEPNARVDFDANLIVWNTQATLLQKYPVNIPYLAVKTDGESLSGRLAQSFVGSSSLGGSIELADLRKELRIPSGAMDLQLDLGMIGPDFQGLVDARLDAGGSLRDPVLNLTASSEQISFKNQTARNLNFEAAYADSQVTFSLPGAIWENQTVNLAGTFAPAELKLKGTVDTTPISQDKDALKIKAAADLELSFYTPMPEVKAVFHDLGVASKDLDLQGVQGYANLFPSVQDDEKHYYIDLELDSPDSTVVSVVGDLLDRNLLLDAQFHSLAVADVYPLNALKGFAPVVSGKISSFLTGDKAVLSSRLNLALNGLLNYRTKLDLVGSYDIAAESGSALVSGYDGRLYGQPLNFELLTGLENRKLTLHSFKLNDQMGLKGDFDLLHPEDMSFELFVRDLSSEQLQSYFPFLNLPEIKGVSLTANYSVGKENTLSADLTMQELALPGMRPLSAALNFRGPPDQVRVSGGIDNQARRLVDLDGTINIPDQLDLRLDARAYSLAATDIFYSPLAEGVADADLSLSISDITSPDREMSLIGQVATEKMIIPDVVSLDHVLLKFAQTPDVLIVDTLEVNAKEYGSATGSGAMDYNFLTNTYFEGDHLLNLDVEGRLFDWLQKNVDMVTSASGKSHLTCSLKTFEDQLMIKSGRLDIENGKIQLKDQPEPIRDLTIQADFEDNRASLANCSCYSGDGKLTVLNDFDEDASNHLKFGFLDLGSLRLSIGQPGAVVHVPFVTTPRNRSNIVLQGQNSPFATITGPFEDMSISGEVLVYNAEAVFPPDTDNLLNLIYSFRGALTKPQVPVSDPIPLPFTMDLMIRMMDNVKYTTYPTNFLMQPGGFMHIIYDGQRWSAKEANFTSEQGTIDFFGTVFKTQNLSVSIIEAQDLIDIQGTFTKESADGTLITLAVNTDTDTSKSIFNRLTFTLKSDNPEDRTVSNILSRLRYSAGSEELSATQKGSLLQDEALSLLSDNLNTSLVSPFLYPVENTIRRWLKLDDFSISAGFIQNLIAEYTTDPNQLAEYVNMNQFMGDIAKFSSAILLNHLSFSLSKYLGQKFFLDYKLTLQEATDLENKTQIMVSHDTSLRWFLPEKFRLTYTFAYEPQNKKLTHELMLQRSFRFWSF